MYNNSTNIGDIGEMMAMFQFTRYNVPIFIPMTENSPIDLVVMIGGELKKIQVKTTEVVHDNSYMVFNTTRTNGFTCQKSKYTEDEVDYFFLYCIENGYCGLYPVTGLSSEKTTIRLIYPKNNQIKNVKWYYEYDFDYIIKTLIYEGKLYKPFTYI